MHSTVKPQKEIPSQEHNYFHQQAEPGLEDLRRGNYVEIKNEEELKTFMEKRRELNTPKNY